jgi:protein required for attachment to host cells
MPRITIVVADAARARLYTYEPGSSQGGDRASLVERLDLINPDERVPPGPIHDDLRDRRQHEVERRFAGEIYRVLGELLDAHPSGRVLIVAPPKMMGLLRIWTGGLSARKVELSELARDLTLETTTQLHDHLASLELVPARQRIGASP